MKSFDIIIIIIAIIIIVALISINVSSLLDNKLSNISVNIPPITIPNPQIIVKVQKTCGSDSFDVYVEKQNGTSQNTTVSLTSTSNQELVNVPNENFTSLAKTYEGALPTTSKNVQYPNEDDLLQGQPQVCKNESLNQQRVDAYQYLSQNAQNVTNFPVCNNNVNDKPVDIADDFRKRQVFVRTAFEDPVVRGYNLDQFDDNTAIAGIGNIPLTNKTQFDPKPMGYIFENSPAYLR